MDATTAKTSLPSPSSQLVVTVVMKKWEPIVFAVDQDYLAIEKEARSVVLDLEAPICAWSKQPPELREDNCMIMQTCKQTSRHKSTFRCEVAALAA